MRVEITDEMKQRTIVRRWAECDRQAVLHFCKLHTDWAGWFEEGVLEAAARQGVSEARRWGADTTGGILDYLTLVYMMGHQFTKDPQYQSWVGPWLKHTGETGERLKTEHLIREALELIPEFYPSVQQWLKALDVAETFVHPSAEYKRRMTEAEATDATLALLQSAWPARIAHLGEEELSAQMQTLNPILGRLGCKTPKLFAVGALLSLRFGIGFLQDPKYPRFGEIAESRELEGHEKVKSIMQIAREFALYPERMSSL